MPAKNIFCMCCNKALSVNESIVRGLGPVCAGKAEAAALTDPNPEGVLVTIPWDEKTRDVIFMIDEDGRTHANIFPLIRIYRAKCFHWGKQTDAYDQEFWKGRADFSASILEIFTRPEELPTELIAYRTRITKSTLRYYQRFVSDVLSEMPKEGATLKGEVIVQWIAAQKWKRQIAQMGANFQ